MDALKLYVFTKIMEQLFLSKLDVKIKTNERAFNILHLYDDTDEKLKRSIREVTRRTLKREC